MIAIEDQRTVQLQRGLDDLADRVKVASSVAGRDPEDITSIIVTKTWPTGDVRRLYELGVRNMAENRDQEARPKVAECEDLAITWHFVGQLQRNKANSVARYADFVHSVDRSALARSLDTGANRAERRIKCFVQVDLDTNESTGFSDAGRADPGGLHRGGANASDVLRVCETVAESGQLDLVGLMAVAPLGEKPESAFTRLATIRESVLKSFPQAVLLSAGMSGDLEEAIASGATHVRVGSAVLGKREYVR